MAKTNIQVAIEKLPKYQTGSIKNSNIVNNNHNYNLLILTLECAIVDKIPNEAYNCHCKKK